MRKNRLAGWAALALALALALAFAGMGSAAEPEAGVNSDFTHLNFSVKDGRLKVFHLVKLKNTGSTKSGPVEIYLPKGYQDLKFSGDEEGALAKETKLEAESLRDPRGLEPGAERGYTMTYDLPMPAEGLALPLKINHPTKMVLILADQATVQMLPLQNREFRSEGSAQWGQKTFDQFNSSDLTAGTVLTMTLGPAVPGTGAAPSHGGTDPEATKGTIALLNQAFHGGASNMMLWQRMTGNAGHGGLVGMSIILTVLALLIFGIGRTVYFRYLVNRGIDPSTGERPAETVEKLQKEKKIYIKKIADLDRSLQSGRISSEEHNERRSAYKRRLVKVMARLKELES